VQKIKEHILTAVRSWLVSEEIDVLSKSYGDKMEAISRELGGLDQRLDNLYNIVESGKIEVDLIKPRLQELKQRHDRLVGRRAELEALLSQRKIELADRDLVGDTLKICAISLIAQISQAGGLLSKVSSRKFESPEMKGASIIISPYRPMALRRRNSEFCL
jgi:hypothetical protein